MPLIRVRDTTYSYIEMGQGPLLLFGHGTLGGKELFLPQLEHLATDFRCVSIDWPGHGDSGYNPAGWTVDDLVADVPALIDALGEHSAVLAGVSQGGAVFMRTALAHPDRVDALIPMCSGTRSPPAESLHRLRQFVATLSAETDDTVRRAQVEQFTAMTFHAPGVANRNPQALSREANIILNHPRVALPLIVNVPASYQPIHDQLAAINCPTLVLWGEHDPRPELGKQISATIPGAELHIVPRAGHHLNVDAPTETSMLIEEFLSTLQGASRSKRI